MDDKENLGYEELETNYNNKFDSNNFTSENTNLIKNNNFSDPEKGVGIGHLYTPDNNNSKFNSHSHNKRKYGSLKCWYLNSNNEEPSIVLGPHCKNYFKF